MKEIKDLSEWRDIPRSWIGTPNIVIYQFSPNGYTCLMQFVSQQKYFVDRGKLIVKVYVK